MTAITHHLPDHLLASYAAGTLPQPFALVVASHVSLCDDCRASLEAHNAAGGVVLETTLEERLSKDLKASILAQLDDDFVREPVYEREGALPGPVMEALEGQPPKWKSLGLGVKQCIISAGENGSVRLLHIPPGQAMPDHSHGGLELTLVLQGSFSDEGGRFGVGDVEVANEDVEHTPIADAGDPCICLAATDAPLKFNSLMPRLLQPIFKI
ncbi:MULTISPECIES: ChrR family anti-sigma-E factor [Halocynthiibacter]|uniref:ChrR family anti-sigma-E factor n=1 Tax=Halocynthiibacter halioticoli TaxID=2986804 RepID=A0AAE3J0S0_9RHOB|nr:MULTISPECIES: ChrR family anti-sigma-E factor [Halocynthiibacter]MCV6823097.1 ChrR family anti-sigma-E factor [Halocynthiibacter halioticoli]MCW4056098.1 ChrR family anti-sigma-E factor [Halocynthiibacter sp. SDUM655004]